MSREHMDCRNQEYAPTNKPYIHPPLDAAFSKGALWKHNLYKTSFSPCKLLHIILIPNNKNSLIRL